VLRRIKSLRLGCLKIAPYTNSRTGVAVRLLLITVIAIFTISSYITTNSCASGKDILKNADEYNNLYLQLRWIERDMGIEKGSVRMPAEMRILSRWRLMNCATDFFYSSGMRGDIILRPLINIYNVGYLAFYAPKSEIIYISSSYNNPLMRGHELTHHILTVGVNHEFKVIKKYDNEEELANEIAQRYLDEKKLSQI